MAVSRAFVIIPKIGGSISFLASSLIIRDVLGRCRNNKHVPLTSLIMLALSTADILSSFSLFLSTWVVPVESGAYLAAGNTATCTAQGFLTYTSTSASLCYNGNLAVLYCLIVRRGWKDSFMERRKVRLFFLLPSIMFSFGMSIPPLLDNAFNFNGIYSCSIKAHPLGCDEPGSGVECTRGPNADKLLFFCSFIPIAVMNIIIFSSVFFLIETILNQERRMDRYTENGRPRNRRNTRKAAWQGVAYIVAFGITWFPYYAWRILEATGKQTPAALTYIVSFLVPLQGLWNACVYFRPKYISERERHPTRSRRSSVTSVLGMDHTRKTISSYARSKKSSHNLHLDDESRELEETQDNVNQL